MCRECSTYGGEDVQTGFWYENLMERDHLKDQVVYGRLILRWIFRKWNGDTDWIDVPENRDRCRALLIVVWNYRVP